MRKGGSLNCLESQGEIILRFSGEPYDNVGGEVILRIPSPEGVRHFEEVRC